MKKETIRQISEMQNFKNAKERLDTKIKDAIEEFKIATPECKLIDIEILMNNWEEGLAYETNGTIDRIRVILEVA